MSAGASALISSASAEDLQKCAADLPDDACKKVADALAAAGNGSGLAEGAALQAAVGADGFDAELCAATVDKSGFVIRERLMEIAEEQASTTAAATVATTVDVEVYLTSGDCVVALSAVPLATTGSALIVLVRDAWGSLGLELQDFALADNGAELVSDAAIGFLLEAGEAAARPLRLLATTKPRVPTFHCGCSLTVHPPFHFFFEDAKPGGVGRIDLWFTGLSPADFEAGGRAAHLVGRAMPSEPSDFDNPPLYVVLQHRPPKIPGTKRQKPATRFLGQYEGTSKWTLMVNFTHVAVVEEKDLKRHPPEASAQALGAKPIDSKGCASLTLPGSKGSFGSKPKANEIRLDGFEPVDGGLCIAYRRPSELKLETAEDSAPFNQLARALCSRHGPDGNFWGIGHYG